MVRLRLTTLVVVCCALAVVFSSGAPRALADTPSYPSWSQVQAAKASAAATAAQVATINGVISQLQANTVESSNRALAASAAYGVAQQNLQTATEKAATLAAQVAEAKQKAQQLRQTSGVLAAQLARSGASNVSLQLFLSPSSASTVGGSSNNPSLLYQLGSMAKFTQQVNGMFNQATEQSNLVAALSAQATQAQTARDQAATQAQSASDAAQSAMAEAQNEYAAQQQHAQTLYAQLASLNNTAGTLQQQYAAGLAAAQAAANTYSQSSPANTGGSANTFAPPPGVQNNPTGAQAYAASVLSSYGWGSDQMQCLISLWNMESGWRTDAYNSSSGAYGIPQALPGIKMQSAGSDWMTNYRTQINWGLSYISARYSTPCGAWQHEMSVTPHWY